MNEITVDNILKDIADIHKELNQIERYKSLRWIKDIYTNNNYEITNNQNIYEVKQK